MKYVLSQSVKVGVLFLDVWFCHFGCFNRSVKQPKWNREIFLGGGGKGNDNDMIMVMEVEYKTLLIKGEKGIVCKSDIKGIS